MTTVNTLGYPRHVDRVRRAPARERIEPLHVLLAALLYVFFGVFLIWPIVQTVSFGLLNAGGGFRLQYIELIFHDPTLVAGLRNATLIALTVTLLTLLIALPLALLSVRYDFPGRGILSGLLLIPLVMPPFVGAVGLQLVLGRLGPLTVLLGKGAGLGIDWLGTYRVAGIILIEALHLYPVMLLNVQASLAGIDPAMEQAAANLGATPWTIFRRITLPMMRPGLFAGATLTLIWSFTELGTPLIFNFYTITPVQIFRSITDISDNPLPYALVIVTLAASTLLYLIGKSLIGRPIETSSTRASLAQGARKLHGGAALLAAAPFVVVIALASLPHIAVILTSFSATGAWYRSVFPQHLTLSHYREALTDDLAVLSVLNSMRYAALATILASILGVMAAIVIVRSRVPGRGLIDALSMLPLAVPGLVLAFGYLAISVSIRRHWPGAPIWLDVQEQPLVFLIVAYAARRLPYIVRAVVAGLQQTPPDLASAAQNLGAGRARTLLRITLPLILANLIAGALLAFAFAMLEVSDSLILAQKAQYYPITKAILELANRLGDGVYIASALGVWAMVLLALTMLLANALLGKRLGAVFRL